LQNNTDSYIVAITAIDMEACCDFLNFQYNQTAGSSNFLIRCTGTSNQATCSLYGNSPQTTQIVSDSQALCIATNSQKLSVTFSTDGSVNYKGFTFKYFPSGTTNSSICAAYVTTTTTTSTTTSTTTTQNPCIILN